MIRNRFWLLPLWVQGLVRAAIFAVAVGGVVSVLCPMFVYRMGVLLTGVSVIALCATAVGAPLYIQRPVRQRALEALGGLDRPRSLAALEALRTGEVPADPDVLATAIRAGAVGQAYQRKTTRAQRAAQWCVPAVAITAGVVELFRLPRMIINGKLLSCHLRYGRAYDHQRGHGAWHGSGMSSSSVGV